MQYDDLRKILNEKGLKVTPQRISVLQALESLHHPSADEVLNYIRNSNPGLATGTVYNILEQFTQSGIIEKVKTETDVMRYDIVAEQHHHLYCTECDTIADYFDTELDQMITEYFKNNPIEGFAISGFKLQLNGLFKGHPNKDNSLRINKTKR
jgi:Fur family transcriptional regulator, peroxide stress response regulator